MLWRQSRDVRAVLAAFQDDLDSSLKGGFVFKPIVLQETREVMFVGHDSKKLLLA